MSKTPIPMNMIGNCIPMFAPAGKKGAQNKRGGIATAFKSGSLIFLSFPEPS